MRRPFRLQNDKSLASMHASCWCTERSALERRVFVRQTMTRGGFKALKETCGSFKGWFRSWDERVLSRDEAVYQLSASKRRRYLDAKDSLDKFELGWKDARVAMFVKADKLDGMGEAERKPRAIQGRSPRFNLEIARYMKPIEHKLMGWKGPRRGVVRSRVFAKGLNNRQRAQLIIDKAAGFSRPQVFCVDASAWDASVTQGHLRLCHSLYLSAMPYSGFRKLLKQQLINKGKSGSGHEYEIKGNRMSGDVDTGIGNSILNVLVFTTAMRLLGVKKWDFLCDGDDALVFVEGGALCPDALNQVCKTLGFVLTGEPVDVTRGNFWDIEFCRSHPIWTRDGWIMCRNMQRAVDCFGLTHRYAGVPLSAYRKFLAGCGICELTVSVDMPMLGELSYFASLLAGKKIYGSEERWRSGVFLSDGKLLDTERKVRRPNVHPRTRAQVAMAFGISIETQLSYEESVPVRMKNLDNGEVSSIDALSGDGSYLYMQSIATEDMELDAS